MAGIEPLISLGLGFVLGLEHALDADHLVAISAIVSRTESVRRASMLGLLWGLGHTITLLFAGLAILTFTTTMIEALGGLFELVVGVVLIVLGISVIRARSVAEGR